MTQQPQVQSFTCQPDEDGMNWICTIRIAVPDSIVAASLIGHITALTSQYKNVQAQVADAEAAASSTVIAATKPATTRRAPKSNKVKKPPPKVTETAERVQVAKDALGAGLRGETDPTPTPPVTASVEPASIGLDPSKVKWPTPPSKPESPVAETSATVEAEPAPVPEVPEAPAPEGPDGSKETCPPDLVACKSFKLVLMWMMEHGYTEKDMIVAKCEEYRDQVDAIQRINTDLGARVDTGLVALKAIAAIG